MKRIIAVSDSFRSNILRKRRLPISPNRTSVSQFHQCRNHFHHHYRNFVSISSEGLNSVGWKSGSIRSRRPHNILSSFSTLADPNQEDEEPNNDTSPSHHRSFRNQLGNQYWSIHNLTIKDAFQTDWIHSGVTHPSIVWTSSFTCPIDGKVYPAGGDLPGDEYRVEKETGEGGETKWYYVSKKSAVQAAAMQAIGNPNISGGENSNETTKDTSSIPPIVTPRQNLVTWYERNHQLSLSGDSFFRTQKRSITGNKSKGGIWWSATFVCPIDAQEFKSMDTWAANEVEIFQKKWFRKKADAIQAAAGHALYIKQLEVADNKSREAQDHEGDNTETEGKGKENNEKKEDLSLATTTTEPAEPTVTRVPLMTHYQKHHKLNITNDDFVASLASFKGKSIGGNWWTATFLCPVTGDRYDSKQLVSISSPSQCHQDSEGTVWYKRKEDSIVAAALGALDTLKFKESGVLEPRYCKEDPSESILVDEEPQTSDDNIETISAGTVISTSGDEIVSSGVRQVDADEDDEDFIIEVVPQGYSFGIESGSGRGATTFDLIADTWLQSTNIRPTIDGSKPRFDDFSKEKTDAINRAKTWIENQQETLDDDDGRRTHFDGYEPLTNMKTANLILESLATANHLLRLSDNPYGIENAANSVLEYMWTTKSTRPNADSYASYIKCLEAESPSSLAKKVQDVYDAMASQKKYKGRILPRPNTAVYNSLIQRLAEAGSETSIKDFDSKIQPDEETFLSALSSMKHPSNRTESNAVFDVEKAQKNIEQMKALSVQPTIHAYNAPLRWVGGLAASLSRPYSECAPWDVYETEFQKGFKILLSDHPLLQEATNVEKWYNSIESGEYGNDVRPNIETMESQIQAWVRTTTRDGLEKACELGEGIINKGDHQLRLQSFHPIMAAWIYSGAEDSPEKVNYWLQRLQSAGLPVMEDGRYRSAPILARLSRQRQLLREREVHELASQTTTDFHQMAVESSEHLNKLIADYKQNESFFLEVGTFQLAIRGWNNVGEACARMGDLKGTDEALAAIEEVVQSFDDLVQYLYISGGENATMQLLHLLNAAPHIYSGALSALNEFDFIHAARDMDDAKPQYLANHLISLERSIRRSEEFQLCTEEMIAKANALNSESGPFDNGVSLHYEDMFSFSSRTLNQPNLAATWPAFFIEVTRALDEIKSNPGTGHEVTRISLLVAEVMQKQDLRKGTNTKGQMMEVLKSIQRASPELSSLLQAVQRVYNPSRKKNSVGPSSSSRSSNVERDSFSHPSTRKGLRRRKPTRTKTHQPRSSDVQQNAPQKRQQHAS